MRPAALALTIAVLPLVGAANLPAQAQSFVRSPNLNIGPRIPTINATPRINPNVATVRTISPNLNVRQSCSYAYRTSDGQCSGQPVSTSGGGGTGNGSAGAGRSGGSRNNVTATNPNQRITNELVAEIDGALTDRQADALARRHRLIRLGSQNFPLIGATIGRFRIADSRSADAASRDFASDASVHAVQPNFRYVLQEQQAIPTEGDPAQYAVAKLRLAEAHTLAHGTNIRVAVIDSGIDASHPELSNSVVESFDALGSSEGAHVHGTGIAGAIAAHARLIGSAPAAQILAIRAFGKASTGAESNTYVVLKGLDYAAAHQARIINMSFAGPKDTLIGRGIAALAAKGIVMIAAAGNAGAKSPPLYPAANPSVIAVSATDAQDRLFAASNRGSYIAIAAPGVDIFLPAPDQKYQMISGTSFSAAYVSGLAALMLERDPALKADELRAILTRTARDLGSPGRDDLFGAGEADAFAATEAAASVAMPPPVAKEPAKADENRTEGTEMPAVQPPNPPVAAVVSDKSTSTEPTKPAAQ